MDDNNAGYFSEEQQKLLERIRRGDLTELELPEFDENVGLAALNPFHIAQIKAYHEYQDAKFAAEQRREMRSI